jgi:hypothetical protein
MTLKTRILSWIEIIIIVFLIIINIMVYLIPNLISKLNNGWFDVYLIHIMTFLILIKLHEFINYHKTKDEKNGKRMGNT